MSDIIQIRRTIKSEIKMIGRGLHSGEPVQMIIKPSDAGLVFSNGTQEWLAVPENVTDTRRSTQLGSIRTVEHIMSALAGSQISDARVEVTGGELPGVDGSSAPFFEAITASGVTELGEKSFPRIFSRVFYAEGKASIGLSAGNGQWKFLYEAGPAWPRLQTFESESIWADYEKEIGPARTFALEEEVPHLAELGLGQGLDEASAVIVGQTGYANAVRFGDEPARHKLLDAIGDIALSGYPLDALNAVFVKSGHTAHVAAAAKLRVIWQAAAADSVAID